MSASLLTPLLFDRGEFICGKAGYSNDAKL